MQTYTEGDLLKDIKGTPLKLFGLDYTEMVYVASGSFIIGDNNSKYYNERPEKSISFTRGYFIGKYAVTQALYQAVMGENPSKFKGKYRPVENVSHDDICQKDGFLDKLNAKIKADYPFLEDSFTLPSEAQWEYAARGGQYWNQPKLEYAGSQNLNDVDWYRENSNKQTMPVGLKQPNALGLHDMSGNIWEWCADWYDNLKELPKEGSPNTVNGTDRVLRGGSFFGNADFCRVASRFSNPPSYRYYGIGFRIIFSQLNR